MICNRIRFKNGSIYATVGLAGVCLAGYLIAPLACASPEEPERPIRGHAIFTVAESKRLIARGVASMPLVEKALRDGMVIVCRGTTNTYVAEELLGRTVPHGAFVLGRVSPEKGGRPLPEVARLGEVIFVKGEYQPELTFDEALERLTPGDVIIKGGNALDYARKTVGVWVGSPTGGTTGKIMPHVTAGRAHLVIPVGLEKQVAGPVADIAEKINAPAELLASQSALPRMKLLPGQIVTEIEAMQILADVEAFQASAGGIGGAEGAVWLVWEGPRDKVEKARQIAEDVHGEPPFGSR